MKYLAAIWFLALLFFLPAKTFAAEQHKSFTLDHATMVGNQTLGPGDYVLRWDDAQDNTTVNFQSDGKTVATAPAQIVRKANPNNASYEVNTASGQNQLDTVYFSKEQLLFSASSSSNSPSNPASSSASSQ